MTHHINISNMEHGGVSIFTRSDHHVETVLQFSYVKNHLEMFTIKFMNKSPYHVISALYRLNNKHIAVKEFTGTINNLLSKDVFKKNFNF